jgi:hypothetical protein
MRGTAFFVFTLGRDLRRTGLTSNVVPYYGTLLR